MNYKFLWIKTLDYKILWIKIFNYKFLWIKTLNYKLLWIKTLDYNFLWFISLSCGFVWIVPSTWHNRLIKNVWCKWNFGLNMFELTVPSLYVTKLPLLVDTYVCPILGALVPLFWIAGDVSSGFQSQSGFCLICFCGGKCWCYTCWPLDSQHRSQSLPHMHQQRWELAQIQTCNHPHRRRMHYHCYPWWPDELKTLK